MGSMASTFENITKGKFTVLIAIIVVIALVGAVFIMFLTWDNVRSVENQIPYDEAQVDLAGVKKADSDYWDTRTGDLIVWPDKLSDIEENYIYGTDWSKPDSDADGMEDGWEALYSRPNPITERLTIDPNNFDAFENPDGDGFDSNNNGIIDEEEALFNLREYVGGVEWDFTKNLFDEDHPVFGGMNIVDDWREIGMKGGFHLYDDPSDGLMNDKKEPDQQGDTFDDYLRYNPYLPQVYKPVTTNPSLWDTDLDGIDDGWETHYSVVFNTEFFLEDLTTVQEGSVNNYLEAQLEGPKLELITRNDKGEEVEVDWLPGLISPLNPADAKYDMDIRYGYTITGGEKIERKIFEPDYLTNLQEYQNHTSPLLWDTDGDSHFNALKGQIYIQDDFIELNVLYQKSAVDWNGDGILDYKTCPYNPDSDGDGMFDGWELETGLNPLNSTDRFKDLDQDGLPNYLENAFPNKENMWFQTDPKNPDTDGDGMLDGWEAYNAQIISREKALNTREDLEDRISDGYYTFFTVTPMIADDEDDNDGWWNLTDGELVYTPKPDGMTNLEEFLGTVQYPTSTDPNLPDTDGDGLTDGEELKIGRPGELIGESYFSDPEIAATYYTNATLADSDADFGGSEEINQKGNLSRTLDDWEETRGQTKEKLPPNGFDDDGDGYIDEGEDGMEYLLFEPTNATNPDTDLDGWLDVDELFGIDTTLLWERSTLGTIRTDPKEKDSDHDTMSDYDELIRIPNYREWITDPNDPDTDKDGMEDGLENTVDFFPLKDDDPSDNYDANGDGDYSDEDLGDIWSVVDRTNPTKYDTDKDGLPDGWEYRFGKIIKSEETKFMIQQYDRLYMTNYWAELSEGGFFWMVNPLIGADVYDDPDHDELTNLQEFENGTHPLKWDTDGDGMPDGWELKDENRGSPIFNPEKRKYSWILDPLDPNDWALDADHDGFIYSFYTYNNEIQRYELIFYYFPWINLYEYQFGLDPDRDGINEITTSPAPRDLDYNIQGGYDSDNDGMPDGWEVWVTDYIGNASDIQQFEDNDTLPKGWEDLFNGSAWNRKECYIYEAVDNETKWDPWADSFDLWKYGNGRKVFIPTGLNPTTGNPDFYRGKMYSEKKDTNLNGLLDSQEDDDNDNQDNDNEYRGHSDPTDRDSFPGNGRGIPAVPDEPPGPARALPPQEEMVDSSSMTLEYDIEEPDMENMEDTLLEAYEGVQVKRASETEIDINNGKVEMD
ncbi:MAG: hypothetical protein ACMUIG_06300 [Thermoplasmatota archaeon]